MNAVEAMASVGTRERVLKSTSERQKPGNMRIRIGIGSEDTGLLTLS
jgi:hypothetical protein